MLRDENKKLVEENAKKQVPIVVEKTPKEKKKEQTGFLAMGSAIERFAEIETLKIEIARLTEDLNNSNKERESLHHALKEERVKVSEQTAMLSDFGHLKEEQKDLLELLAHIEAERVATQKELESVAGVQAVERAKMYADESLKRACGSSSSSSRNDDDDGIVVVAAHKEENKKNHLLSTPPTPPAMRKKHPITPPPPVHTSTTTTTTTVFDV